MLSNTAVPIYYGRFRDAVINGEIPVNKYVSMEMNRIDRLIENPGVFYDDKAVEGFVQFCEKETTLTDGAPLKLLETFKLWAEQLLGWYYYVETNVFVPDEGEGHWEPKLIKKRLITKQYLIVGRGAAKSMYASCLQNYFLNIDKATTYQITTAPTMKQAEEVMSPIRTSIARARGPLFKFLTCPDIRKMGNNRYNKSLLSPTKKGIENFLTNSLLEIRPMSIDKLQGLRCKIATVDEWLSGDIREDPILAIEQGCRKVKDYAIVAISSEGTVRNGPGDTIKMRLIKTLKGEYIDPHTSIWYYCLDDISEVGMPEMWLKANPNLGKTVTYEDYQLEVEQAEHDPSAKNDILAKRFGIPSEGLTYFFTYEETLPHNRCSFWKMPCAMGADLSQGNDFCAFTFLFPLSNGCFGIKTRSYITTLTHQNLHSAMREKYQEFIDEGSLIIMDGAILDMDDVYEDVDRYIQENDYDVCAFGYDPYNSQTFVERWTSENGPYGTMVVKQGTKTESVPLGELKNLASQRMLIFDEKIMSFTMGNAIALVDTNGGRKLYKVKYEAKIDNVAALMDAFVAYKANKDAFM